MKNLKIGIMVLAIGLFILPNVMSIDEIYDVEALVIPFSFQDNDISNDGKVKIIIQVASAPTNTLSVHPDMFYNDRVTIDINKQNKIDEKITASIKSKELLYGRNITKITWTDGRRIYP